MLWLLNPRPSFTHVSTHQTYVGKALFEHARSCATIAAVACMSSSLLKSSLGPNLLALIPVEDDTFKLFDKIFLDYNPHMQLTQKLVMESEVGPIKSIRIIKKLKSNGSLFSSSLQEAKINLRHLSLFKKFRVLRSLSLSKIEQYEQLSILKSLPSLSELKLIDCDFFDEALFEALGDLENNLNFTSLDISSSSIASRDSAAFQKDFCGRLLSKNRLTILGLPSDFGYFMNEEDDEAFVNAGMTNLVELRGVPASLIRGDGFVNLRVLGVDDATDENLVNVGNHCLFLEVLELGGTTTGSFLNDENLAEEAFRQLRELMANAPNLSDSVVGQGFCRLALERLHFSTSSAFDGSCLQYLPNPDQLRSVYISGGNCSIRNLHRFVNLEELDLWEVQVSREDILSFARFEKLKRICLRDCGVKVAGSKPFRILLASHSRFSLPNLEKLYCLGSEASRWSEEDVEAILNECKTLRLLMFAFESDNPFFEGDAQKMRMNHLEKKFPWVVLEGELQKNKTVKKKSGSRRKREE